MALFCQLVGLLLSYENACEQDAGSPMGVVYVYFKLIEVTPTYASIQQIYFIFL